jgi:D-hexose-6-phosphate mutarotase
MYYKYNMYLKALSSSGSLLHCYFEPENISQIATKTTKKWEIESKKRKRDVLQPPSQEVFLHFNR